MRRKHGGRESGGGDAESERERERDGVIRTAEGKWACRDSDKVRRRGEEGD